MTITYYDLIGGHVLKEGDTITIYGRDYTAKPFSGKWYMECFEGNNIIFKDLNIDTDDVYEWANKFGGESGGLFPWFNSVEKMTNFVIDICETYKYKVGDKVRINTKVGYPEDYPECFIEEMAEKEGKIFTISKVGPLPKTQKDKKYFNGDIHIYELEEDDLKYVWHSSMFEKIETYKQEVKKPVEEIPDIFQETPTKTQRNGIPEETSITIIPPKPKQKTTIKL